MLECGTTVRKASPLMATCGSHTAANKQRLPVGEVDCSEHLQPVTFLIWHAFTGIKICSTAHCEFWKDFTSANAVIDSSYLSDSLSNHLLIPEQSVWKIVGLHGLSASVQLFCYHWVWTQCRNRLEKKGSRWASLTVIVWNGSNERIFVLNFDLGFLSQRICKACLWSANIICPPLTDMLLGWEVVVLVSQPMWKYGDSVLH